MSLTMKEYRALLRRVEYDPCGVSKQLIRTQNRLLRQSIMFLDEGCARRVFRVEVQGYEPFALKVAYAYDMTNDDYSGHAQNLNEVQTYQRCLNARAKSVRRYVPRIFDWDTTSYAWVEVELLRPCGDTVPVGWRDINRISKQLNLLDFEIDRPDQWGYNTRGEPKLMDMGVHPDAQECDW